MATYDEIFEGTIKPQGLVHVTGESGVGKSLFAIGLVECGLDPERICVFDGEQSLQMHHRSLGFGAYYDLVTERISRYGLDSDPQTAFTLVLEVINEVEQSDKEYDVVVFDNPAYEFETGIQQEVESNPKKYKLTRGQMERAPALKWGPIKTLYGRVVQSLRQIAPLYIITTQLGQVWYSGKPVPGLFKPKGKQDIQQMLTFMRVWLRRSATGSPIPDGLVLKTRLVIPTREEGTGKVVWKPILPQRLSPCSWPHILEYMRNPPDLTKLSEAETLSKEDLRIVRGTLSPEQHAAIAAARAESELELARARKAASLEAGVQQEDDEPTIPSNRADFVAAVIQRGMTIEEALKAIGKKTLGDIEPVSDWPRLIAKAVPEA